MTPLINNNPLYRTFTPFISENTKTAEKTMNGKHYETYVPPYKLSKELYGCLSAGGLLLFPILALAISKKNILSHLKNINKEYFRIISSETKTTFTNLNRKFIIKKYQFLQGFWGLIKPLKNARENYTLRLNSLGNNSIFAKIYRGVNQVFKNGKTRAAARQYKRVTQSFGKLERSLEPQLKLLEESSSGKIKIAFPKEILKDSSQELPVMVDLSKTANGLNRANEIKRILAEIKQLLSSDKGNFEKMVKNITFSCEDIFVKAESTLVSLHKTIAMQGKNSNQTSAYIKEMYRNLVKYRFAEHCAQMPNATPAELRAMYIARIKDSIEKLKAIIPENPTLKSHIKTLEEYITSKASPEEMGLLEQLRMLLKCSDIKPTNVKDGIYPATLKHYRPDDYMDTKNAISSFAKNLKFAQQTKQEILPSTLGEINRGGIFTKGLAIGIPALLLGTNIYKAEQSEEKIKSKRDFYSFLLGSLAIGSSHYFTMNRQTISVLYGIITAYITSKVSEKLIKNNLSQNK